MIKIKKIKEINESLITAIQVIFSVTIPTAYKNFFRAMTATFSGEMKLFYLALGIVQRNVAPDTADSESVGGTLERWGRIKLGRNPFPARAGKYQIIVTGEMGAFIKAQTTFKSDDTSLNPGFLFILDEGYTLVNTSDYITVRALTAGVIAKLDVLDTLTATAPILLVDSGATVYSEVVQPLAAEEIEAYRAAVLNSYRLEAQGGADTDYRLWSQDAQGVKAVYPYARSGFSNQVNLFIEANRIDSTDGKGTPGSGLLADVEAVVNFSPDITQPLNDRGRRPTNVIVNYIPITVKLVEIKITSFFALTTPTQTLISNGLNELVDSIRPFVAGADILENKNDILDRNRIIAAIIEARPGAVFGAIELKVAGVIVDTFTFENGDIPYLNLITYV
jgi:hypothetical protein